MTSFRPCAKAVTRSEWDVIEQRKMRWRIGRNGYVTLTDPSQPRITRGRTLKLAYDNLEIR